jgi:hypothetical protein
MMAYQKTIVHGKIDKTGKKEFKTNKHLPHEKDLTILFDDDVDFVVEKLSTEGLPAVTADNRTIAWHNNFLIMHADGSPMNGVAYSVLLEAVNGDTIVVYDETGLHTYAGNINPKTHNNKKMKEIRLAKGDPAIGIVK